MKNTLPMSLVLALSLWTAGAAMANGTAVVTGEKLDSGLGQLPHYSTWADRSGHAVVAVRVPGESLDQGLGELPHFSRWVDKSGADPMGLKLAKR